jgi:hypothetical protein
MQARTLIGVKYNRGNMAAARAEKAANRVIPWKIPRRPLHAGRHPAGKSCEAFATAVDAGGDDARRPDASAPVY